MDQLSFVESFRTSPFILTEGAIVERLRHEFQIPLDKHIVHAALIYNDSYRETLAEIYRQYLQIAADADDSYPQSQYRTNRRIGLPA